jgi:FkbM family methyltransferase
MRNNLIKKFLKATIYRDSSVATILFGPSKGLKYKVNSVSGLAAIYGGYQKHIQKAFVNLVSESMVVYDIGANCGLFTILLSKLVGREGFVYSFEPVSYIAEQIRTNVKLNNINNVTIIVKAVSDSLGLKGFDLSTGPGLGFIVDRVSDDSNRYIQVESTTLDHFVFFEKNPAPQLIKIDVEGHESRVIEGAHRLVETYRPIIICDLHSPSQDVMVGKILIKYQYGAYRLDNREFVKKLDKGWPTPAGLWGSFVGYPLEKDNVIRDILKIK